MPAFAPVLRSFPPALVAPFINFPPALVAPRKRLLAPFSIFFTPGISTGYWKPKNMPIFEISSGSKSCIFLVLK